MSRFLLPTAMLLGIGLTASAALADAMNAPWQHKNSAIVLDAYEYTLLDWEKLKKNKRLAGFINKASDGLPPTPTCGRDTYCRLKWRRYVAAKELYHTRKTLAKTIGLKWGAYHLARPGNPIQQADHFLRFTKPSENDLLALDIEHNDPSRWMSLKDAEIFARYVKKRTGRYPVLYTNHATAKFIAQNRKKYRLLAKLNLWYARYKSDIRGVFPMGNWPSYTLWQFSSMANCNKRRCLRRIAGADNFIDVNVVSMSPARLRRAWPFSKLTARTDLPDANPVPSVVAKASSRGKRLASALVSAFLPPKTESASVHALGTMRATVPHAEQVSDEMVVKGYVPVPRWPREYEIHQKTIIAEPEEIGVPNPLASLALGPLRPQKTGKSGFLIARNIIEAPHALDALAEPRETMVRAERALPIDGVLKLFPAEAIMTQRLSMSADLRSKSHSDF
ncbi:MAG: glycoside hydrolase family 25 protein [Rhizobiaceae bacterium]